MTNANLTRFLVYLSLLCIPNALAETDLSVTVNQCQGSTDVFTIDSVSLTCDDDNAAGCSWGSAATINGTFTIGDGLYTASPYITASLFWENAAAVYSGEVDICVGNGNCPDADTYSFITGITLPGSSSSWYHYWFWYMTIAVWVTLDFGGDQEVACLFLVQGRDSSSSSSYMIAGSAMLFVGIAAFGMRKRRRIVTEEDVSLEDGPATRFIEMNSAVV